MSDHVVNADSISARWDDEYRGGRYEREAPLPFVRVILDTLRAEPDAADGTGLYVGCGNGRNYLALVDAGARLHGVDISGEAIRRLRARRPGQALPLEVADFRAHEGRAAFDYLVAIQVFQHSEEAEVARYFLNAASAVRTGGLFFLRVNSASTEVYHRHTVLEVNPFGGFTIRYDEGPKAGLAVHFYSRNELIERTAGDFLPMSELREETIHRTPPQTGSWAQWEGIWRRRT